MSVRHNAVPPDRSDEMTRQKPLLIAAAAFCSVVVAADAAIAQPPQQSIYVSRADLDLGEAKDVRTLERRIERAMRRLCGSFAQARNGREMDMIAACRAEARQSVAPQLARAVAADKARSLAVLRTTKRD
jgi:UrcA family protein